MRTYIRPIRFDAGRFPAWQSESARVYAPLGPETLPTTIELSIADAANEGVPLTGREPENRAFCVLAVPNHDDVARQASDFDAIAVPET
jgi:hypothetical protein